MTNTPKPRKGDVMVDAKELRALRKVAKAAERYYLIPRRIYVTARQADIANDLDNTVDRLRALRKAK